MNEGLFYRIFIKRLAKQKVHANWVRSTMAALFVLLMAVGLAIVSGQLSYRKVFLTGQTNVLLERGLLFLLLWLLVSPLFMGFTAYCIRTARDEEPKATETFSWLGSMSKYLRSIQTTLTAAVFMTVRALPIVLLPGAFYIYAVSQQKTSWILLSSVLFGIAIIFALVQVLPYVPGVWSVAEDASRRPAEELRKARTEFGQRKWDVFCFFFSYFGWIVLMTVLVSVMITASLSKAGALTMTAEGTVAIAENIAPAVMADGIMRAGVAVGLLLLYVLPYFGIAFSYYIRGVRDPDEFNRLQATNPFEK